MATMICRNCGTQNRLGSSDCARCRFPLDPVHVPALARPASKGVASFVFVAVFIGIIGAVVWLTIAPSPPPQRVAEAAATSGDTDASEFTPSQSVEPTPEPIAQPPSVAQPPPSGATSTANSGSRTRLAMYHVIRAQSDAIRKCYEAGLAHNPQLRGTVKVKFVIAGDGHVSLAADDSSDLPDSAVKGCVLARIRALRFAPSDDGPVTVSYPFKFGS